MDVESHTLNPFYLQRSKQITRWNPEKKLKTVDWTVNRRRLVTRSKVRQSGGSFHNKRQFADRKNKRWAFLHHKGHTWLIEPSHPRTDIIFSKNTKKIPPKPGGIIRLRKIARFSRGEFDFGKCARVCKTCGFQDSRMIDMLSRGN